MTDIVKRIAVGKLTIWFTLKKNKMVSLWFGYKIAISILYEKPKLTAWKKRIMSITRGEQ